MCTQGEQHEGRPMTHRISLAHFLPGSRHTSRQPKAVGRTGMMTCSWRHWQAVSKAVRQLAAGSQRTARQLAARQLAAVADSGQLTDSARMIGSSWLALWVFIECDVPMYPLCLSVCILKNSKSTCILNKSIYILYIIIFIFHKV
jgi:hypothetical protein